MYIYMCVEVVLINVLVSHLAPPNKNSWLRPCITFWTVEDLRIVLVSLHLLIKSSITQPIKKKKKISCMFRIIPKSIIRPMNNSKNKLNSKKSWLFKQCQMHTSFLYNDSLSCLKRKVCMPDLNDSGSFEVRLLIYLFRVDYEFPTMGKSLWD